MAGLRVFVAVLIAACAACSASPQERIDAGELASVTALKQKYPVLAGFDIRPETTLIVSVDLQNYIEMDDADIPPMQRAVLARWRDAWSAAHPHAHATLHVRFIDFIGRKVATLATTAP